MTGTLGLENRLNAFLQTEGMSADFFAALSNGAISPSRLRLALSGARDLEHEYYSKLEPLLAELREIAREHEPFRLRYQDPTGIKKYTVQQTLKALGWHRTKGGPDGASPWHQDANGKCPYEKPQPKTAKPEKAIKLDQADV
jgi:hypothetical protein